MRTAALGLVALIAFASPGWASQPRHSEMTRIPVLAHRLHEAARKVHLSAQSDARDATGPEVRALRRLSALEERAADFQRRVEQTPEEPGRTVQDFRTLANAYQRAARSLQSLHAYPRAHKDFDRVSELMDELYDHFGAEKVYRSLPYVGRRIRDRRY